MPVRLGILLLSVRGKAMVGRLFGEALTNADEARVRKRLFGELKLVINLFNEVLADHEPLRAGAG